MCAVFQEVWWSYDRLLALGLKPIDTCQVIKYESVATGHVLVCLLSHTSCLFALLTFVPQSKDNA